MTKLKNIHTGDVSSEKLAEQIRLLLNDSLSDDDREMIQRWFWEPEGRDRKLDVLADMIAEEIIAAEERKSDCAPTEEEIIRFNLIQQRIGRNEKNNVARSRRKNKFSLSRSLNLRKIAAVLVPFIFIAGGVILWQFSKDKDGVAARTEITHAVMEGIQKDIKLADNSTVWINSGSTLTAPEEFAGRREVKLEGEAFFAVEKDGKRPFIVRTKHLQVKVLGTEFNIIAHDGNDMTEVILHSGSIEVTAGRLSKIMKPGEKLTYVHSENHMYINEPKELTDWRSTKIYVQNKTLDKLFLMLANYYDVEIIYNDPFPSNETYSVTFGKHIPISQIIEILSQTSGRFVYAERDGKILIEAL